MCHPHSKFSAVVCDGTVVTKSRMQRHTVSGPRREQWCSVGRNANFLQLQIVVEQKRPFFAFETVSSAFILSSQVVRVKTLSKLQFNTHTRTRTHSYAHTHAGRWETTRLSLPSPLFWERVNMQVWLNQIWECGEKMLGWQSRICWSEVEWLSWTLKSSDGCGQARCEEVKLVPHNSQEKSQKHESVLTYLKRAETQLWTLTINKWLMHLTQCTYANYNCNVSKCPLEGELALQIALILITIKILNNFCNNPY